MQLNKFQDFFSIFTPKCIGIDISDYSIESVELKNEGGKIILKNQLRMQVQPGIFESGKILNEEKMVETLKELREKLRKEGITNRNAIASLPESKVLIKVIHTPKVLKEKQERENIYNRLGEVFPYDPDEIYWDYQKISENKDVTEVLVAAVENSIVDNFIRVFKKAGFNLLALDTESLSIARTLASDIKDGMANLIIDSGARATNLIVVDKNGVRVTGSINIAGNAFSKDLMDNLGVTLKDADEIKEKIGLDKAKNEGKILIKSWEEVVKETSRLIQYFETKYEKKVTKIILCGGSALLPKLPEFLKEQFNIPAELATLNLPIKDKRINIFMINAVGLAMRGISKNPKVGINLLF